MNNVCRGNTGKLLALMDGKLRPAAADRLRVHLDGCEGCAGAFRRLKKTKNLCRELGSAEPTKDLSWRQIEAQIHWKMAKDSQEDRQRWRPVLAAGALAAAAAVGALAAVVVLGQLDGSRIGVPAPREAMSASAPGPTPTTSEELAAIPTLVQGNVHTLSPRGELQPLELSRPLLQGAWLISSDRGKASLQWAEGSGIMVSSNTEATLGKLASLTQEVHLWRGKIFVKLAKLEPSQRFSIMAQGVRISVRGTYFSVAVENRSVDVEVFEGRVFVEPEIQKWKGVNVPAGSRIQVPFGTRQAPPISPLASESMVAARKSTPNFVPWPSFQKVIATTGLLTVVTRPPGAEVLLDSRSMGHSNLELRGTQGRHGVELWKDGKLLGKRWVDVQGGNQGVVLDFIPKHKPRMIKLPNRLYSTIRQRSVQIRDCHSRWGKHNSELVSGKLTFKISVDGEGTVTDVKLLRDTFKDQPKVGKCAQHKIERWSFPPGKPTSLIYPFIFRLPGAVSR